MVTVFGCAGWKRKLLIRMFASRTIPRVTQKRTLRNCPKSDGGGCSFPPRPLRLGPGAGACGGLLAIRLIVPIRMGSKRNEGRGRRAAPTITSAAIKTRSADSLDRGLFRFRRQELEEALSLRLEVGRHRFREGDEGC